MAVQNAKNHLVFYAKAKKTASNFLDWWVNYRTSVASHDDHLMFLDTPNGKDKEGKNKTIRPLYR